MESPACAPSSHIIIRNEIPSRPLILCSHHCSLTYILKNVLAGYWTWGCIIKNIQNVNLSSLQETFQSVTKFYFKVRQVFSRCKKKLYQIVSGT